MLCDVVVIPGKVLFQIFFLLPFSYEILMVVDLFFGANRCHLNGKYSGVLLDVVGMNGNNRTVLLAICVSEIKNTEAWRWFMEHLNNYLDDGRHVTFISDRQKELIMQF